MKFTKRGTANALRKAAKIIEERGWTKLKLEDKTTGCVCAMGAYYVATTGKSHPTSLDARLIPGAATYPTKPLTQPFIGPVALASWNDFTAKSGGEVASLFRKMARALEHGGKL